MSEAMYGEMEIAKIVVKDRVRKDMGDLDGLCESLRARGMLNPVLINGCGELVAGERRLRAAQRLGWATVPARCVKDFDEAVAALLAERDENTCRKDWTPTEMVEIGRRLRAIEEPKAKERQRSGLKQNSEQSPSAKISHTDETGRTTKKIADAVGTSDRTYEKAEQVVEAAEKHPEIAADLPARMDAESVDAAHKELKKRQAANGAANKPAQRKQTTKAEALHDATGAEVPPPLRDVFGDPWLADLAGIIDGIRTQINSRRVTAALKGKSQAYSAFLRAGEILKALASADDLLEEVESDIRAGTPHAVHQDCGGKGCDDCRKAGWLPKWRYDELAGA